MIKKILGTIKNHKIYADATVLFIATSLGNVFSLLFHLFMVRALTPEEYGVLNTLFACIMFFAMPTGNLQITITRFVARYHGMGSKEAVYKLLKGMASRILILGCVIAVLIFFAAKPIAGFFRISNITPIYSMAGVVVISLLMPIPLAGLHGLQRFLSLGLAMISMNLIKLILAVLLVWWGFGVSGALNSLTIASLLCVLIALPILKYSMAKINFPEEHKVEVNFKEIYLYIFPVSLAILSFVLLTNLDIILVKHFFHPLDAGYYSIAQVNGKMVLFLPGAICMVMFPKVANSHAKKEGTISYLKHSSLYIIALVAVGSLVVFMFPQTLLKIFTGKVYPECYPLVRRFAISMGFFAISFNFLLYYLSLNKIKFIMPFLILLLVEGVMIYFWHSSLVQILDILIGISVSLFLINLIVVKKNFI